jgi:4-hydroxy-tetrahydrodipicolinate synthase
MRKEIELRGVFTAMITPFTKKDNLDEEALHDMIETQIGCGIDGLVPCGTTGESPTLSHDEHDRTIALTVEYAAGRVPVIAGTGSNATSEAIRLSRHAQAVGASAVLLVNPYYNKPTQKGLFLHFKAIADSVDLPCILYNIKGRTGVNLETPTLVELARSCPNIVGVKEASGSIEQIGSVIAKSPEGFRVLSGDDNLTLDLVEAGGDGVVSVASNICPEYMARMVHLGLEGKKEESRAMEANLAGFFKACFLETNPIPIKSAMARYGWCEESFRLPLCNFEHEEHRVALFEELEKLDALGAIRRR